MAERTNKQGFGVLGVGTAACIACCAPLLIGFLAAASIGTLIGVTLFGAVGLGVAVIAVVAYLPRRRASGTDVGHDEVAPLAVALGRKPGA